MIAFLRDYKSITRPFLIVAPLTTLGNWMKEFSKWLPKCRVIKLNARKEERIEIIDKYLKSGKFDVILTSYEGLKIAINPLSHFNYKYLVIDEAHILKNENTILSKVLRTINCEHKLLLTGTPL